MTTPELSTSTPATPERTEPPLVRPGGTILIVGGLVLAAGFLIGSGPDIADVHNASWVPGHLLNALGFLLLALALPTVAGGRITEAGTHDELLTANGLYATLWKAWTSTPTCRPP